MHRFRSILSVPALIVALVLSTGAAHAQDPATDTPDSTLIRISENWLKLLDTGRFEESLEDAAPLLRQMAGSAERWQNFLKQARPVGRDSVRRDLLGVERDPEIPAAPEGRYVTVAFTTDQPEITVESVVLVETDDGWKPAMYMMRAPESMVK